MNNLKKAIICFFIIGSSSAIAKPAESLIDAQNAIKSRQAVHLLMYNSMMKIKEIINNKKPYNESDMKFNAQNLYNLTLMVEPYFMIDTSGFKIENHTNNNLWLNEKDITNKSIDVIRLSQSLLSAAEVGDKPQIASTFSETFKACKACHYDYKIK